jgi:hypothetical protein
MTLTKRNVDKIIKRRFFYYRKAGNLGHNFLCKAFKGRTGDTWEGFWNEINNKNKATIGCYLRISATDFEHALLRLLIVEEFKKRLR